MINNLVEKQIKPFIYNCENKNYIESYPDGYSDNDINATFKHA